MTYDLERINELCRELGLRTVPRSADRVAVELEEGLVLVFVNLALVLVNIEQQEDCLAGFEEMDWHCHGDFIFMDPRGHHVKLGSLDVLTGLVDGQILLCELWRQGERQQCWLVHRDFMDEFGHLRTDEEIRVRRVSPQGDPSKS